MRLINTATLELHEFFDDSEQRYAILSHTWGDEECTLQQMSDPDVRKREGYAKIEHCCRQARADGLEWAWIDTCCIDKTSTAELSEAINSMSRWYSRAEVCYAHLADVEDSSTTRIAKSRWLTRGWTLQELIAPRDVRFYSHSWTLIGHKSDPELSLAISIATGIDAGVLSSGDYTRVPVAGRMRWAANRETRRLEDRAYSLMGLFDVNMPLIYGEGQKAFLRLQQEIIKISNDPTIFAWGLPRDLKSFNPLFNAPSEPGAAQNLFASAPSDFATDFEVVLLVDYDRIDPPVAVGSGLRISYLRSFAREPVTYIELRCGVLKDSSILLVCVPLFEWRPGVFARCGDCVYFLPPSDYHFSKTNQSLVVRVPRPGLDPSYPANFTIQFDDHDGNECFVLEEIHPCPSSGRVISFRGNAHQAHACIVFKPKVRGAPNDVIDTEGQCNFAVVLGSHELPWAGVYALTRDGNVLSKAAQRNHSVSCWLPTPPALHPYGTPETAAGMPSPPRATSAALLGEFGSRRLRWAGTGYEEQEWEGQTWKVGDVKPIYVAPKRFLKSRGPFTVFSHTGEHWVNVRFEVMRLGGVGQTISVYITTRQHLERRQYTVKGLTGKELKKILSSGNPIPGQRVDNGPQPTQRQLQNDRRCNILNVDNIRAM